MSGWRRSFAVYSNRRVLLILPLGFASGLPLLLTFSTLSAWLARAAVEPAIVQERQSLEELLRLHYRYRFDPQGIDADGRRALRDRSLALAARLKSSDG